MKQWPISADLFARAQKSLAGGISSNVRAGTQPFPLFFERAAGAMIYDVDGHGYIDYLLGQGPMLLGHSHPAVLDAVAEAMQQGQLYAGQHRLEIEVAETLQELIPSAELCRFGLGGSEMVQAAMRLARAVTGRSLIIRFEGHYHGWFDNVLLSVAPPVDRTTTRRPQPTRMSAGQVAGVAADFIVLPWNDLALLDAVFAEAGPSIAAVMMEPMMCNTGAIPPEPGYLEGARRLCDDHGALLFFDEVITGFRLGLTGAQGRFGVWADLVTYAKALAGGFAGSALVGRRTYMTRFTSDVNHSGTFNSNVIAMAATAAALRELARDDGAVYRRMEARGQSLMAGIREIAARLSLPVLVQGLPMAFHMAFTELDRLKDYRDYALACDQARYNRFSVAMLERGVRLASRGIWYLSAAHDEDHIARTLETVEASLGVAV